MRLTYEIEQLASGDWAAYRDRNPCFYITKHTRAELEVAVREIEKNLKNRNKKG